MGRHDEVEVGGGRSQDGVFKEVELGVVGHGEGRQLEERRRDGLGVRLESVESWEEGRWLGSGRRT